MKNRLDDFFKNKLDNHETLFNDAAWDEVLGELDARDSKKKRILFFWFTGIGGILALVAFSFYYFNNEEKQPIANQTGINIDQPKEINTSKNLHKNIEKEVADIAMKPNVWVTTIENEEIPIPVKKVNTEVNEFNNFIVENPTKFTSQEISNELNNNNLERSTKVINSDFIDESILEEREELQKLSQLESKEFKIEFPEGTFNNKLIPIRKMKHTSWEFGLIGKGIVDNQSNSVSGWGAGLYAEYRFNYRLSLGSGVIYNQLGGEFEATKTTNQITYGFGSTTSTQRLTPESLSILEVPLNIGYNFRKNKITAGVSGNYLLAVLGEKETVERIAALPRSEFQSGRLNSNDAPEIPKFNWAAQVAYERDFRFLNVGLRGKYYLNNYFQNADQPKSNLMTAEAFIKLKIFK